MAKALPAVARQLGPVASGLGVLGLASFAFTSLVGRVFGPARYAPLGTLWVLINALGPALFQPLEQEIGRAVASGVAHGTGARPVFLKAVRLAASVVTAMGLLLLLARGPLADAVFAGQQALVGALFVGMVGLCAEHLTRGAFAGGGHFGRYGAQLGIDGILRIGSAAVLAGLGVATVGWYGLFLGLAPVLAVVLTARRLGPAMLPGPAHGWGELTGAVGWLTVAALGNAFVVNAAPVAVNLLAGPGEQARAGAFIAVLVLARVPLFLYAAIQASFLPGMAALAAAHDNPGFRRRLVLVVGAVSALGLANLLALLLAGPWLVHLVYGPDYDTTRGDLWPIAAAGGLYMVGSAVGQSLIAVRAYRSTVLGWVAGAVGFVLVLLVPLRLELRVGLAFLVASAVAAVVLAGAIRVRLRSPLTVAPELAPPSVV